MKFIVVCMSILLSFSLSLAQGNERKELALPDFTEVIHELDVRAGNSAEFPCGFYVDANKEKVAKPCPQYFRRGEMYAGPGSDANYQYLVGGPNLYTFFAQ